MGLSVSDDVDVRPGDSRPTAAEAANPEAGTAAGDGGVQRGIADPGRPAPGHYSVRGYLVAAIHDGTSIDAACELAPGQIPIGPSSPPAKTTSPYGAPTPASSPGSGSVAQPAPQPSQPRGILPSLPTSPTLPSGYWPGWYIIRAIHVHMIQQGYAAAAVGGAWLVLLLAGWWKPKPSWIDRSGRILGILWVVPYLVYRADLSRLWY